MYSIGEKVIVSRGVTIGTRLSGDKPISYIKEMLLLQGREFVVTQIIYNVYGETAYRLSGKASYFVWLESWLQVGELRDAEVLFNG